MNYSSLRSLSQQKCCRICFDKEFEGSKLIAPCKCRGSSRYIHIHCLSQWQETAIENNAPQKATTCPVCLSEYTYPSKLFLLYRRLAHHCKTLWAIGSIAFFALAVTPLKLFLHAVLVIITIPFGQISLGKMALAWIGCDFPPQLALIRNGKGLSIPSLRRGMLLIASRDIPNTSVFYKSVILILEHSKTAGSRGIIINLDRNDSNTSSVSDISLGNGGPMESDVFSVLHDCKESKQFSKVISSEEHIFVAENEHAFQTVQFMLRMKMFENKQGHRINPIITGEDAYSLFQSSGKHFSRLSSLSEEKDGGEEDENDDSRWETASLDTIVSTASNAVEGRNQYIRAFTSLLTRFSQRLRSSLEMSRRQLSEHTSSVLSNASRRLDALRPTTFRFQSDAFPLTLIPEHHELDMSQSSPVSGRGVDNYAGNVNLENAFNAGPVSSRFFSSIAENVTAGIESTTSATTNLLSTAAFRNPNYHNISLEERGRELRQQCFSSSFLSTPDASLLRRRHNSTSDEVIHSLQTIPSGFQVSSNWSNSVHPFHTENIKLEKDDIHDDIISFMNVRFVRGNCLWLPGQLVGEVWARDWHLLPPRHENVFLATAKQKSELWSSLITEAETFSDKILPSSAENASNYL